jgi:hypothetical protein
MLNVVGAKDDGAAHLAADPVLARLPQDQVLARRKDRPSEIARHDISRHPIGHGNARPMPALCNRQRKERGSHVRAVVGNGD